MCRKDFFVFCFVPGRFFRRQSRLCEDGLYKAPANITFDGLESAEAPGSVDEQVFFRERTP
jgi:hypothetical protein